MKLFWLTSGTDLQHFNLTQQKFPLGSLDGFIGKLHILKKNKLSSHDTGKAIAMVPHEALKSGMLDTSESFPHFGPALPLLNRTYHDCSLCRPMKLTHLRMDLCIL